MLDFIFGILFFLCIDLIATIYFLIKLKNEEFKARVISFITQWCLK